MKGPEQPALHQPLQPQRCSASWQQVFFAFRLLGSWCFRVPLVFVLGFRTLNFILFDGFEAFQVWAELELRVSELQTLRFWEFMCCRGLALPEERLAKRYLYLAPHSNALCSQCQSLHRAQVPGDLPAEDLDHGRAQCHRPRQGRDT